MTEKNYLSAKRTLAIVFFTAMEAFAIAGTALYLYLKFITLSY